MKKTTGLFLIIAIAVVLITSCKTYIYNHQKAKTEKFLAEYPMVLSEMCAKNFVIPMNLLPGRDSVHVDSTVYFSYGSMPDGISSFSGKGTASSPIILNAIILHDTVTKNKTVTITITHRKVDTLKIENTAKYDSLKRFTAAKSDLLLSTQKQLSDQKTLTAKYEHNSIVRLWILIGLIVAIAAVFVIKFYFF